VRLAGLKEEEEEEEGFLQEGGVPSRSSLMAACRSRGSSVERLSRDRLNKSTFWEDSCMRAWA